MAWLLDATLDMKLHRMTFVAAVVFTDRYLEKEAVEFSKLQLCAATALLLASKVEECNMFVPLEYLQFACASKYSRRDFVEFEMRMVRALDFKLFFPFVCGGDSPFTQIALALYLFRRHSRNLNSSKTWKVVQCIESRLRSGASRAVATRRGPPWWCAEFVGQLLDPQLETAQAVALLQKAKKASDKQSPGASKSVPDVSN